MRINYMKYENNFKFKNYLNKNQNFHEIYNIYNRKMHF